MPLMVSVPDPRSGNVRDPAYPNIPWSAHQGRPLPAYMASRQELLEMERAQRTGGKIKLSLKEQKVNKTLMAMKEEEYKTGLQGKPFPPALHFMIAKPLIDKSRVFDVIKMMPKGAALHLHDVAITNRSWVISELTYLSDLYYCQTQLGVRFYFASQKPTQSLEGCSAWEIVADARKKLGNDTLFDEWLLQNITMLTSDPHTTYPDTYEAWNKFLQCLFVGSDLMYSTEEIFRSYIHEALMEFHQDNVQYLEIRYLAWPLMTANGTKETPDYTLQQYIDVVKQFKAKYPDFYGAKFISQTIRIMNESDIEQDIKNGIHYKNKFPHHYAGFDLVGQEDTGFSILHYIKELLLPFQNETDGSSIPFFFHAGETGWGGTSVDENLFDAILLNTSRIGHGYAITKHPVAMEMARERDIAIEINPISNQVLGLVSDLRNHPGASLIAQDFPLVISSDDPPIWGALPMSHDFYMAFMGLGGKSADLATLKQLALNSIKYSATSKTEKAELTAVWTNQWNVFLDKVIDKYGKKYLEQ
ncbi:adenosine deaminase 2-like [Amphiura filiformis]|uniref:adenosine deaminase 2-like n=1 Tax=Amphiura filiformis TaxID=82378 RepID=UPI003B20DBFF